MTFTCALIGPDGAGKSTVSEGLSQTLPLPVKLMYMGVNPDAGNYLLPTTRIVRSVKRRLGVAKEAGGPPALPSEAPPPQRGLLRRALRGARAVLRLGNRLAEEWYRQILAWYFQRRGYVVVFDRHYIADYHAHHVRPQAAGASLTSWLHGFVLRRFYPKPDLVIVLDAPAELLFARKAEGTLAALERRRAEYLALEGVFPELVVVDASQPRERVLAEVAATITAFQARGHVAGVETAAGSAAGGRRDARHASDGGAG
jgi:thymidylate kinase